MLKGLMALSEGGGGQKQTKHCDHKPFHSLFKVPLEDDWKGSVTWHPRRDSCLRMPHSQCPLGGSADLQFLGKPTLHISHHKLRT